MLWTIFVILLVLWLFGLVSSYTMGGFIHLPADHCGGRPRDSAPARPPNPATVAGYYTSSSLHSSLPGGLTWEGCA